TSSSSWFVRASHHSLTIIAPFCHRGYGHTIDNALSRRHHSRTLRLLTSTLISARGSSLAADHRHCRGRQPKDHSRPPEHRLPLCTSSIAHSLADQSGRGRRPISARREPSGTTTPILTTIKGDDFPH
uniref:Uncharacterized protein n=1 Tax=Caenorhabditis japonica TaxID=281687 RepID=A0A8R1IYF4_CAEJA